MRKNLSNISISKNQEQSKLDLDICESQSEQQSSNQVYKHSLESQSYCDKDNKMNIISDNLDLQQHLQQSPKKINRANPQKTKHIKKVGNYQKKKSSKIFECPFCQKKDKNSFRIRQHAKKCKIGPSQETLKTQIKFLQQQKKIGMKICRHCHQVYKTLTQYHKHVNKCKNPQKQSLYDDMQPNVTGIYKNKGKKQRTISGWVVCPYCTRNIRNSLALIEHLYNQCIKNPRNPSKFKYNLKSSQGTNSNQNLQDIIIHNNEYKEDVVKIDVIQQEPYYQQVQIWVEDNQIPKTIQQQNTYKQWQKQSSSKVRKRVKSLLKMQRLYQAFNSVKKNQQVVLEKCKLLIIQKILFNNRKLFLQSIQNRLKDQYGDQAIDRLTQIELQAIIIQAILKMDVPDETESKMKQENNPSIMQLELQDSHNQMKQNEEKKIRKRLRRLEKQGKNIIIEDD